MLAPVLCCGSLTDSSCSWYIIGGSNELDVAGRNLHHHQWCLYCCFSTWVVCLWSDTHGLPPNTRKVHWALGSCPAARCNHTTALDPLRQTKIRRISQKFHPSEQVPFFPFSPRTHGIDSA